MLWAYRRVVLGTITNPKLVDIKDMNAREVVVIAPLAIATIVLGVYPSLALDLFGPTVESLLDGVESARLAAAEAALQTATSQ